MFDPGTYSVDQKLMKEFVRQLSRTCDPSYFIENMKNNTFPREYWKIMGEAGTIGLLSAEAYGGTDYGAEELTVLMHTLARNGLASFQLMHQIVCCVLVETFGSERQKEEHLPALIDGKLCGLAASDLKEGMNLFEMSVSADRKGAAYRVNGTKGYVFGAKEADVLILAARTSREEGEREGITLLLFDPQEAGIDMRPKEINIRTTATLEPEFTTITGDRVYEVRFKDVDIPVENRIGREHGGGDCVQEAADLFMMMLGTAAIGWGESVLDKAVEHSKRRAVFEEPIGSYQAVQHPLARARTDLELAKLAVTRAVTAYQNREEKEDVSVYASVAKAAATEAALAAFDISKQAHGGYSADRETGIITLWPMVLLSRIIPLNNDAILETYSEAALGLPGG